MQNKMIKKNISKDHSLAFDSEKFEIKENKKYFVEYSVSAQKGSLYSVYFSAILLDESLREIDRKILWITNFNDKIIPYKLAFTSPSRTKFVVLGYRINIETPVKSDVKISIQEPSSLVIYESNLDNDYSDDIKKYEIPKLPELTTEEESILESKLVWLCASPRSGTTWLGTQLLNHDSNIIWHEPWIGLHLGVLRGGLAPARDFHRFSPEDSQPTKYNLSSVQLPKIDFEFERIIDMQSENGQYFFSPHHKNNWMPFLKKMILNRTYSHAQSLKKNIIIKDPVSCNGTDIISECFPKSKIIFLVRDGRDEVDSRIDMHRKNSWAGLLPLFNEQERLHAISYYSKLWNINVENIKKGFDSHPTNLKILVKYENLLIDTLAELKKIYDFIGVEIAETELKKIIDLYNFTNIPDSDKGSGKFNRSATVGGWQKNFNIDEQTLMNQIMGHTLQEMGYEL